MERVFRLAAEEDLAAVVALYRDAVGTPGCTWNEFYPTKEDAESDLLAGCLYVLTEDERVIGALSVVPENELDGENYWHFTGEAREVARLTVARDRRGHGLASEMLTSLFPRLKGKGVRVVRLLAATQNGAACRTYEKLGFSVRATCEMYGNVYFAEEKEI